MFQGNTFKFIVSLILAHSAGVIGSFFTIQTVGVWYESLARPAFSPPSWVFAPVWLTLYTLIGISLFLLWRKGLYLKRVRIVFNLFLVHLVVNTLWSVVFFGMNELLLSVVTIGVLWLMIAVLIMLSWDISRWAALLLIPYLLWVSFAAVLNISIWQLNPEVAAPVADSVLVQAEYSNRIVYTTDASLPEEPFRRDCKARGGEFRSCGSVCAPEADVCATVCAYTCELSSE